MEILNTGNILAFVSLILGLGGTVIARHSKAIDMVSEAQKIIKDHLLTSYEEFAAAVNGGTIINKAQNLSTDRLKRLHYACISDVMKVKAIDRGLLRIFIIFIIISICAILILLISFIIGKSLVDSAQKIIMIFTPVFLLLVEITMICIIFSYERFLKALKARYDNLEYSNE